MKELESVAILLQIGASIITKKAQLPIIKRGGKRYYKVEQLIHCKMEQSLLHRGTCIRKSPPYNKVGQVLQIGARYMTKWAGNLLQNGSIFIAKWGRYY